MSRSKALALSPFVALFAMFVYLCALRLVGDPRFQEPRPAEAEFRWFETAWAALALLGVFFFLIRSIWRAAQARQIGWAVAMFMIWPLAAVYIWKEDEEDGLTSH